MLPGMLKAAFSSFVFLEIGPGVLEASYDYGACCMQCFLLWKTGLWDFQHASLRWMQLFKCSLSIVLGATKLFKMLVEFDRIMVSQAWILYRIPF